MAELLDRWMDHIAAQGRAPTTMARYRSAISANIKPRIGDMPITKVGPAELDGLYSQLARTGLAPLSIRKSHAILSAAFNQARRAGLDIDFRQGMIEDLPFDEASVDAVTSTMMMHHLADDLKATGLAEIGRVHKPGGRVVIADFTRSDHGHDNSTDDQASLAEILASAGFVDPETEPIAFPRDAHGWSGASLISASKP